MGGPYFGEKKIDDKHFGGGVGTSTTDALVEMIHHWCEATYRCGTYVRIVLIDFAKAFDLINHEKLLVKLKANDVPPHNYIKMDVKFSP